MNYTSKLFLLVLGLIFFVYQPNLIGQNVQEKDFNAYKTEVQKEFKKLEDKLAKKDSTLKRAEEFYNKANQHIGLTEKVDSWFSNFLGFLAAGVSFILALLGYNLFMVTRSITKIKGDHEKNLEELRSQLIAEAQQEIAIIKKR